MELKLRRIAKKNGYTIGKLSVDGKYFCDTLEDVDRGLVSTMAIDILKKKKLAHITAIPTGRYEVTMSVISTNSLGEAVFRDCLMFLHLMEF